MSAASSPRGSSALPVERRRRNGGPKVETRLRNDGWLRGLHVHLLRYRGKTVARAVRCKRTSDALGIGKNRLVSLDVVEANRFDAVDLKQVDDVAATALVDAKVTGGAAEERARLVNVRLLAGLCLVRRLVRDGRGVSSDKSVVDGHDLVDSPRPSEPLAHVGCCKADAGRGASRDSKLVQQN
eukprot:323362-Pleurochrysis_carterae.AAC.2